jgi:hypothetical protein
MASVQTSDKMRRDRLIIAVLALVVVTAGCATDGPATPTPADGQTNVTVPVENDGNSSYTAEVRLVPDRLSQLNVEGEDGVSRPVTNLSSVRGVYAFARQNVTDARLPPGVEARSSTRFQLAPADRSETRLSAPVSDATLLVVIRQTIASPPGQRCTAARRTRWTASTSARAPAIRGGSPA